MRTAFQQTIDRYGNPVATISPGKEFIYTDTFGRKQKFENLSMDTWTIFILPQDTKVKLFDEEDK